MELSYLVIPILLFVLLKLHLEQRATAQRERVRLLDEALRNPALDRATIESLAYQLTGTRPPQRQGQSRLLALLLALGWLTLFSGLGVWLLGHLLDHETASAAGVLVSLIGFGLVTYPFALRELEARQKA